MSIEDLEEALLLDVFSSVELDEPEGEERKYIQEQVVVVCLLGSRCKATIHRHNIMGNHADLLGRLKYLLERVSGAQYSSAGSNKVENPVFIPHYIERPRRLNKIDVSFSTSSSTSSKSPPFSS